jgi:hypothetical protein
MHELKEVMALIAMAPKISIIIKEKSLAPRCFFLGKIYGSELILILKFFLTGTQKFAKRYGQVRAIFIDTMNSKKKRRLIQLYSFKFEKLEKKRSEYNFAEL